MRPDDLRRDVIEAIRESLPEFADRNGIVLPEKVMDNLAAWVAGVVPPYVYREGGCIPPNYEGPPIACACPGTCQFWTSAEPLLRGR